MAADMDWGNCGAVGACESILRVSKSAVARLGNNPVKINMCARAAAARKASRGRQPLRPNYPWLEDGGFCALRTGRRRGDPVLCVLRAERMRSYLSPSPSSPLPTCAGRKTDAKAICGQREAGGDFGDGE